MTSVASNIAAFFSNSSPTLPSIAIPSKPSIQALQTQTLSPSSNLSNHILSEDSLTIAAAAQAVALANSAAQAARDAGSLALTLSQMAFIQENELTMKQGVAQLPRQEVKVVSASSKQRRKKKRRPLESLDNEAGGCCIQQLASSSASSSYLTCKEEAELTFYVKEGARLEAACKSIQELEECDPSVLRWAKAVGMTRGSLEMMLGKARLCREKISLNYRRLIVAIATPYLGKGLSLHDLVQEGSIGLLKGLEKFDSKKGCKLSTYVYWWIKQAIIKAIATKSRPIRLPGSMQGSLARITKAKNTLRTRLGRWPTYDEIANATDVSVASVKLVSERTRIPISLDQPMSSQGSIALKEIISGPEEAMPEAVVARQHMKQDINNLLKTLSEREERILRLYFGLHGGTALSCEEIGKVLNLSRERVRQLRYIALSKLQERTISESLKAYMT